MESKFKKGNKVKFLFNEKEKTGVIIMINTYFQIADITYDIYVEKEDCLFKHVAESDVFGKEIDKRRV